MRIREPFRHPTGRRIRVLIYARYSTDEQCPLSIDDQYGFCTRFLTKSGLSVDDVEFLHIGDPELSGELVSRPGIDLVKDKIELRQFDVLIAEDSSRLYRNVSACISLVEHAVDAGIRVLCINDFIDTYEADWHERLTEAAQTHAKANRLTSARIKRAQDSRFLQNAAMGLRRPGYTRRATYPATDREPEKGPFFDSVDEAEAAIIVQAYERTASGDPAWSVAEFLTAQRLRKCSNARDVTWDDRDVYRLIRRTVHRGVERYREKISQKKYASGKRKAKRNVPEDIQTRAVPHLRIVDDALWHRANDAIDARCTNTKAAGEANPLYGIARDSRFPLSTCFLCFCGRKMWAEGRNEGAYRCSGAKDGSCWNRATALRELTHQRISETVVDFLFSMEGTLEAVVEYISKALNDDDVRARARDVAADRIAKLERECARLAEAIAHGDPTRPLEAVLDLLGSKQRDRDALRAELQRLDRRPSQAAATPGAVRLRLQELRGQLLELDRRAGPLLGQLIEGPIRSVPYLQLGTDKVVLRAEFVVRPVAILPVSLRAGLAYGQLQAAVESLPASSFVVDLFSPSLAPKHAMAAMTLIDQQPSMTMEDIGRNLGVSKRSACVAVQLGRRMRDLGLEDPFIRLNERPQNVSRWR